MKRKITILFMLLSAMLCFTGCKHELINDASEPFLGYWECEKLMMEGNIYDKTFMDSEIPINAVYTLAIADNGTGYLGSPMSRLYSDTEDKQSFTWKEENGSLLLSGSENSEDINLTKEGESLLMIRGNGADSVKVWFKKVDSFTPFSPDQISKGDAK